MSRGQKVFLHLANIAVCGTGLVYAWMRFLAEPADEWAVVNHPWQPVTQHLHVLAAPLLIFAVGLIWSSHILGKLNNGRVNRVAGIGLMALFVPMAASGYLLQVAVNPGWREAWVWVHVVSSLLWVAAFVLHQVRALTTKTGNGQNDVSRAPVVTPFRNSVPSHDPGELPSDPAECEASARRE